MDEMEKPSWTCLVGECISYDSLEAAHLSRDLVIFTSLSLWENSTNSCRRYGMAIDRSLDTMLLFTTMVLVTTTGTGSLPSI